jgi:hypothetical protein
LLDYHPDAAKDYISGWKAVGAQLADAKTKPHSGVLNPGELSTAYDATNKPIADYLKSYIGYWTDDLRDSLKVAEFTSWANIFTNDLKGGQWEVKALLSIQDMDDKSQKAIDKIRPYLTAAAPVADSAAADSDREQPGSMADPPVWLAGGRG